MPAIIRINLETGSVSRREQEKDDLLLGGRRLTGSIIAAEVPPECEPLSGRNKLVLACGPLAGTLVSSANRLSIGAKSPLTGGIKESNAGGMTGYLMGRLGIRAVVLEGRPGAPHWTLIRISADGVELLPGDPYVGLGLFEKARQLFERFGPKVGMTLIGRAGERLQFSAGITNTDPDGEPSRYNGRGGLGAVMGSKGVQGIVYDASAAPKETFVDRAAFMEANREVARRINANPQTSQVYRQYGTAAMMDATSAMGALPTRNFSTGFFEGYEKINAEAMHRTILERGGEGATSHACMVGCLVKCSNIFPDRDGKKVCSPIEYENLGLLGSNLGIDDLDTIALLNRMCNDFGYDTIETGAAIGVAMNAGLAFMGLGYAGTLPSFTALFALAWVAGQACGGVVGNALMGNWFVRCRGRAFGLANLGTSLSGALLPFVALVLVTLCDVRMAFLVIGGFILALAPLCWAVVRDTPEELGLSSDGVPPLASAAPISPIIVPWRNLLVCREAYCIGLSFGFGLLAAAGVLGQLKPRFADLGFSDYAAMGFMCLTALFAAGGKYLWGWICDLKTPLFSAKLLMIANVFALGLAFLPQNPTGVLLFATVGGACLGGFWTVLPAVVAHVFGRRRFVPAYRFVTVFITLKALGYPVMGFSYQWTGSYDAGYLLCTGILLACFLMMLMVREPGPAPGAKTSAAASGV